MIGHSDNLKTDNLKIFCIFANPNTDIKHILVILLEILI